MTAMTTQLADVLTEADGNPALLDTATGALSRAAFVLQLEEAAALGARIGHAVSVLVVDVSWPELPAGRDGGIGDLVLTEIVDRVWGRARRSDTIARIGGARMAVLLPATDREGAKRYAAKVAALLEGPYRIGGEHVAVTFSIRALGTVEGERPVSTTLLAQIDALGC
jgi:diguanylate cyclase (GGDEF)-like protein